VASPTDLFAIIAGRRAEKKKKKIVEENKKYVNEVGEKGGSLQVQDQGGGYDRRIQGGERGGLRERAEDRKIIREHEFLEV